MAKSVSKKGSGASGKGGSKARQAAEKKEAQKRERNQLLIRLVGALVLVFLGLFLVLSMLGIQAAILNMLRGLFRGLFGYGYWLTPIVCFMIAWLIVFHNHEPLRLRAISLVLLAVLFSSLLHSIFSSISFDAKMISNLWNTGVEGISGGVIPGLLAQLLIFCLSRAGAVPVLLVLLVVFAFLAFRISAAQLIHKQAEKRREIMEQELMDEPDPITLTQEDTMEDLRLLASSMPRPKMSELKMPELRRRNMDSFDIPLDDMPVVKKKPTLRAENPVEEQEDDDLVFLTSPRKKPAKLEKTTKPEPSPFDIPIGEDYTTQIQTLAEAQTDVQEETPEEFEFWDAPALHEEKPVAPTETISEVQLSQAVQEAAKTGKVTRDEAAVAAAEVAQQIEAKEDTEAREPVPYQYPPMTMLAEALGAREDNTEEMRTNVLRLEATLKSFGVDIKIENVVRGPTVTRYEMELKPGVKMNKITGLHEDIALALGVTGIRIAAVPGKNSIIGIEVPNKITTSVPIREVLSSKEFKYHKSPLAFALGKDIGGNYIVGDIAKMPHLLIAGTTGSGKSVCMNSIIVSLLYRTTPEQCRMIMIDPKVVELSIYNDIPHLLIPVVTDAKKAAGALQWAVTEMERRYKLLADYKVRDMAGYNKLAKSNPDMAPMPQVVIIIDELADLMLVAAKEVENSIVRIAQKARAAGMFLVIATQRPSADVITGLMKANIPSRIAFAVASAIDSRIILDDSGAEKLVGKGDMLYAPLGGGKPKRVQGCFITDTEVEEVAEFVKGTSSTDYSDEILKEIESNAVQEAAKSTDMAQTSLVLDGDELLPDAVEVVLDTKQASVSMLQRRLKLGYAHAARIMDEMEEKGIVGPFEGSKARQLLITREDWNTMVGINPRAVSPQAEPVAEGEDDVPFDEDA